MRRILVVAGVALLAGCSSGSKTGATSPPNASTTATSAAPSSDQPPVTTETCATPLPDRGDIISREIRPGLATDAIELGGTDPEHCVLTFDYLRQTSPIGAGNCTQAAWASDNPGYDPNATPAPPLKKVEVAIGDCG